MDYLEKHVLMLPYKQYKETGKSEMCIVYEKNLIGISSSDCKRIFEILSETGSIEIIKKDEFGCHYKLSSKVIRQFDLEPDLN